MRMNRRWLAGGVGVALLAGLGVGVAVAASGSAELDRHAEADDDGDDLGTDDSDATEDDAEEADTPITDADALERATAAALSWLEAEHGVTGTVTETEVGDEESHYEVEVTLDDGRRVDVQLTEDFEVVGLD